MFLFASEITQKFMDEILWRLEGVHFYIRSSQLYLGMIWSWIREIFAVFNIVK